MVLVGLAMGVFKGFWIHTAFCLFNLAFLAYAIVRFIGLKESREDLAMAYHEWRKRKAPGEAPSRISLFPSLPPARFPLAVILQREWLLRPVPLTYSHFGDEAVFLQNTKVITEGRTNYLDMPAGAVSATISHLIAANGYLTTD